MSFTWPNSRALCFTANARAALGAKVFFYSAGTSTPLPVYQDDALSVLHTHPVLADANGRWPRIFMPYGSYRERVTTSSGVVLWDDDDLPNPAPVTVESGGDTSRQVDTGTVEWSPILTTRANWVRLNGRTIGSALSGANERPNADTATLYALLWGNLSNTICPVSGGRGVSASADFAANKTLTLIDMRGRVPFGLDSMGNSAAARIPGSAFASGINAIGTSGGASQKTLSITEIPSHDHGGATGASGDHTHTYDRAKASGGAVLAGSSSGYTVGYDSTATNASGTHTHTIAAAGGSTAFDLINPGTLGTWFVRL